jgi:16S rRNA (cytosine1402-N4)-methyltransferase
MSTHIPVLLKEVIEALAVQPGGRYIDCTLGGGGHALAILENSSPGGQLLGIDADPSAIETARHNLAAFKDAALFVNDNYVNLKDIAGKFNFQPVHGILFDLGLSSLQLGDDDRGFSFQKDAPLDMRFNPYRGPTAADLVNSLPEIELARIIYEYGEERQSRRIAKIITENRPVDTTMQLAELVEKALGGRHSQINPATRTFQALRIAVNHELDNLKFALEQSIDLLGFEGRLVIITYHSLEDRIVKQYLSEEAKDCVCPSCTPICNCKHHASIRIINKKVITPSLAEVRSNPRSRSAKLRAVERIINHNKKFINDGKQVSLIEIKGGRWRKHASVHRNLQEEVLKM